MAINAHASRILSPDIAKAEPQKFKAPLNNSVLAPGSGKFADHEAGLQA